jgi:hypothetical protein
LFGCPQRHHQSRLPNLAKFGLNTSVNDRSDNSDRIKSLFLHSSHGSTLRIDGAIYAHGFLSLGLSFQFSVSTLRLHGWKSKLKTEN